MLNTWRLSGPLFFQLSRLVSEQPLSDAEYLAALRTIVLPVIIRLVSEQPLSDAEYLAALRATVLPVIKVSI